MQTPTGTTPPQLLPELWTDEQLAEYLGCTLRFVRRLADERRIAYTLVGRHRRYRPEDVAAYLDRERKSVVVESVMPRRRAGRPKKSERGAA